MSVSIRPPTHPHNVSSSPPLSFFPFYSRTGSPGPPRALPTDIPNLASVLREAGYPHVEWHGKWHLGGTPADYGFEGWHPPDAGNYLTINDTLGGGDPNNDGRFTRDVCQFLDGRRRRRRRDGGGAGGNNNDGGHDQDQGHQDEPFCLVVSLVNPHDVYVAQHDPRLGYTKDDFNRIHVPLPPNMLEDPNENNKPRAQGRMSILYDCVPFENNPQDYVNFYAHLHTVVDAQIGTILDQLDAAGLTESTLIVRTADHGEQALSHSLVEKFYNCYEESIRIPFIVSNPVAFPLPRETLALSSHLDIVPTLASLLQISNEQGVLAQCQGADLTPILDDSSGEAAAVAGTNRTDGGVQSRIHFTYDDISCPGLPSIVRCIRKRQHKYAVYFNRDGSDADWELYDLDADLLEDRNLAGHPEHATLQQELDDELRATMAQYGTLPTTFEWPPSASPSSIGTRHGLHGVDNGES